MSKSSLERLQVSDLVSHWLNGRPLIDVRAPIEYQQGHLPFSINLPLLNDTERSEVGTTYKKKGREAAIFLGHQIVSGELKQKRLESWKLFIHQNPDAIIYCFRGGLRSQTVQAWLNNEGIQRPLLAGGYKEARKFLQNNLDQYCNAHRFLVISGRTGSHKTIFLKKLSAHNYPIIDLEELAHHRGSAFGAFRTPQPSQADFENRLSLEFIKKTQTSSLGTSPQTVAIEDESRMIGKIVQPESLFTSLRSSPLIFLDEPLESRVQNILDDYVKAPLESAALTKDISEFHLNVREVFSQLKLAVQNISKKLGGLHTSEILNTLNESEKLYMSEKNLELNRKWIKNLLINYYDPLYDQSFNRRQPQVLFSGNTATVEDYFKSL